MYVYANQCACINMIHLMLHRYNFFLKVMITFEQNLFKGGKFRSKFLKIKVLINGLGDDASTTYFCSETTSCVVYLVCLGS